MRAARLLLLGALLSMNLGAQEYVNAVWRQELLWTRLVGDAPGTYRVHSAIITGVVGVNAAERYSLEVRVTSWNTPFEVTRESATERETLTVTLRETTDPKEMEATFEHVVYEGKKVKLKFAGVTRLMRSD